MERQPTALRSWVWSQHWHDVLFLHWRVDAEELRPHVPAHLDIDTWDGDAWVSLVLFRLRVRPRLLPFLPWVSDLTEANLRTYVRCRGRSGIMFLSVHGNNRVAMRIARLLTPMPYEHALMCYRRFGERFRFEARSPSSETLAALTFIPTGEGSYAKERSLDEWLLERYRLFISDGHGRPMTAEVAHPRWVIRSAIVSGSAEGFGRTVGPALAPTPDLAHFSDGVRARFGTFRRLEAVGLTTETLIPAQAKH